LQAEHAEAKPAMMSFWLLVVTSDAAQAWTRYTVPWTKWNHVRTVACIAAAAAFIAALFA